MIFWPKELRGSLNTVCGEVAKNLAAAELQRAVPGQETAPISRNWWTYTPQAELYFRITRRLLDEDRGAEDTIELASITVAPEWRCYGYATRLIASLEALADSTGRVLFVENLLEGPEGSLARILKRRQYLTRYLPGGGVPDMYRLPKDIHDFSICGQRGEHTGASRDTQASS